MALQLGLTGDVMLGRLVDEAQRSRPPSAVWGDVRDRLRRLDGLLINLECCLSTRGRKWQRTNRPFHFRADPDWAVPALRDAGVSCCALANNHVLDFEEPALLDTLAHLDHAGIAYAGAGETEQAAFAPATFTLGSAPGDPGGDDPGDDEAADGRPTGDDSVDDGSPDDTAVDDGSANDDDSVDRTSDDLTADGGAIPSTPEEGDRPTVAVVSLTDNTPEYAAGEHAPGTAHVPIDVADPDVRSTVEGALGRARAREPDLLIASLHWGPNMVTEPPEGFRRFGRWLVDQGVDLVHGHSAHVVQGIEVHDGAPILYDCGDFVDDYAVDADLRNDLGFLFEATVDPGGGSGPIAGLRLHPTEIEGRAVHRASESGAAWIRERTCERSAALGTDLVEDDGDLVLALD